MATSWESLKISEENHQSFGGEEVVNPFFGAACTFYGGTSSRPPAAWFWSSACFEWKKGTL